MGRIIKRILTFTSSLMIAAVLFLCGCGSHNDEQSSDDNSRTILHISVKKPVDLDFDKIKKRGTLRMITRYSSNTYFLTQGQQWGFEYELVKRFAKNHHLNLHIIVTGPEQNPYDLLNSGKGDLIAGNYTATPERKKYVDFTQPYNIVNQVVVFSDYIKNPPQTIQELAKRGITVTIRQNSSYYQRLLQLHKDSINIPYQLVPNEKDTESLLFDVSRHRYTATVADDNIFRASNQYMDALVKGPMLAKHDSIAWAVRKNAPELKKKLNHFLHRHFRPGKPGEKPKRSAFLNILRKRYFQKGPQIAHYYNPESQILGSGVISPYDDLIKEVADSANVNWLMIASVIAQESQFNPKSTGLTGAIGLMQVLPRYSQVSDSTLLYDAKTNIREGTRILKQKLRHYSYIDSTNRWAFALASYNVGEGHIADARRLAIDRNKNPNNWNVIAQDLVKLMQYKYYKNARYGFCRGVETVHYVQAIVNRYHTYQTILTLSQWENKRSEKGVLSIF